MLAALLPMAMILAAPFSAAACIAISPTAPIPITTTLSPNLISALSAPLNPVVTISTHIRASSISIPSSILAKFISASSSLKYSANTPSIVLPRALDEKGLPA